MGYLISFDPKKTTWRINPRSFIESLTQDWPSSQIREINDPIRKYSHEWTINRGDHELEGMLSRKETSVYIDGDLPDCGTFALWFRQRIPLEIPLVLYDENYEHDLELTRDTTKENILKAFP
jgi:hypothetical protein